MSGEGGGGIASVAVQRGAQVAEPALEVLLLFCQAERAGAVHG